MPIFIYQHKYYSFQDSSAQCIYSDVNKWVSEAFIRYTVAYTHKFGRHCITYDIDNIENEVLVINIP